jgi:hypothetical protein
MYVWAARLLLICFLNCWETWFAFLGVYSDAKCSSEDLDHGVLAVGYGVANDPVKGQQEYYIVKNR